jgi:di/tricarboxylate transporter
MNLDQMMILGTLICVFGLFIANFIRFDLVALFALLTCVILGLIPADAAFSGFGHPATITVAAVLIISRALGNSGAVDYVARTLSWSLRHTALHIATLSGIGALLSAIMNNVGALALLMPAALQSADKAKRSPAVILMPLSFATILGGMMTLIGTPPNIIIANYRGTVGPAPFGMFDFTPVGATLAAIGLIYVAFIGWRLLPDTTRKRNSPSELFNLDEYVTEARVPKGRKIIGQTIAEVEDETSKYEINIVGLIRRKRRSLAKIRSRRIHTSDILIVEANPEEMEKFVTAHRLTFVGIDDTKSNLLKSDDVSVIEAVVTAKSRLAGRVAGEMRLKSNYGVNLLAVSRGGTPFRDRLRSFRFQAGDVILVQGEAQNLPDVMARLACLPLATRGWQVGKRQQAGISVLIFTTAILGASFDVIPMPIALCLAALLMIVLNVVPVREAYDAIDWPVIVLLGAMIPVAGALESTGTTKILAGAILAGADFMPAWAILTFLLVLTMTLSDIMNNAATAVVMAPIATSIATGLNVSNDPFLMAVAVGASSAFLTPIGHQNNTLVMGPGGYAFGDYWRMGLPLEVLLVVLGVPTILLFWPL